MKKAIYGTVCLTVLALALLGTYYHVFAQEESRRGNPPASAPVSGSEIIANVLATNETLSRTYLVHGTKSGTSFPASTFTAVDPALTVQCPGTTKCTITADIEVQTGNSSTSPNNYAVCLYVDGVNVDSSDISNGCHYTADTPISGFVEGVGLNELSGVAAGNHTVQT